MNNSQQKSRGLQMLIVSTFVIAALFIPISTIHGQTTQTRGQQYATLVGAQGQSATALINYINSLSDADYNALVQHNSTLQNPLRNPQQIAQVVAQRYQNPDGTPNRALLEEEGQRVRAKNPPSTCTLFNFSFNDCIFIPLISWVGSLFLSMGGAILGLSASVFEALTVGVVIDFKSTLQTLNLLGTGGGAGLIESAWTIFRDLGNIFIIAIFLFIAISLILGLQEYGQKRLIARVLVVAVLMNFSLLFAKIVVDVSNYVAFSIYSQSTSSLGSAQGQNGRKFDIAERYLEPMGVTNVWNTYKLIEAKAVAENAGRAFAYGFFGGILLLIVAVVLMYGAFLLGMRFIMLIILMMTAPIAFWTYLLPNLQNGPLGWSNWWKSLINNAAFAPIFMIFLSISMLIVNTTSMDTSSVNTMLGDPKTIVAGSNTWMVLFKYLLSAGLLFASIKLAHGLAGSIGNANYSSAALKLGKLGAFAGGRFGVRGAAVAGGGAALGAAVAARGTASAMQNTVGRMAASRLQSLQNLKVSALDKARNTGRPEDFEAYRAVERKTARTERLASSSFNFAQTGIGKALAKGTGLSAMASGSKGSVLQRVAKAVGVVDPSAAKKAAGSSQVGVGQSPAATAALKEAAQGASATQANATAKSAVQSAKPNGLGGFKDTYVNKANDMRGKVDALKLTDDQKRDIRERAAQETSARFDEELLKKKQLAEQAGNEVKTAETVVREKETAKEAAAQEVEKARVEYENTKGSDPQIAQVRGNVQMAENTRKDLAKKFAEEVQNINTNPNLDDEAKNRAFQEKRVAHERLIAEQDNKIKEAREHMTTVEAAYDADATKSPAQKASLHTAESHLEQLRADHAAAQEKLGSAKAQHTSILQDLTAFEQTKASRIKQEADQLGESRIAQQEANIDGEIKRMSVEAAGLVGGTAGAEVIYNSLTGKTGVVPEAPVPAPTAHTPVTAPEAPITTEQATMQQTPQETSNVRKVLATDPHVVAQAKQMNMRDLLNKRPPGQAGQK